MTELMSAYLRLMGAGVISQSEVREFFDGREKRDAETATKITESLSLFEAGKVDVDKLRTSLGLCRTPHFERTERPPQCNIQGDWNEDDTTSDNYIRDKPVILTEEDVRRIAQQEAANVCNAVLDGLKA